MNHKSTLHPRPNLSAASACEGKGGGNSPRGWVSASVSSAHTLAPFLLPSPFPSPSPTHWVSLCSPSWTGTLNPPASACQVLELQKCSTTSSPTPAFSLYALSVKHTWKKAATLASITDSQVPGLTLAMVLGKPELFLQVNEH
jgi:hypothetical protein